MTDPTPAGDRSLSYWATAPPSVSGMLGGVPSVSGFSGINRVDLQGSRNFLAKLGIGLKNGRRRVGSVLEGGAGIGRVTEGLLIPIADAVDVIEPVAKLTLALRDTPGVRDVMNVGLAEWRPSEASYDLIWYQWCLGYLTDPQLVEHLRLCKASLMPGGWIVVKENLSSSGGDLLDEADGCTTRGDEKFREIFGEAGLLLVRTELQKGIPQQGAKRLLPIRMYALKPDPSR